MNCPMDNLSNTLLTVCGVGGLCCGGSFLALFVGFRLLLRVPVFASLAPILSTFRGDDNQPDQANSGGLFGGGGGLLGGVLGGVGALFGGLDGLLGGDNSDDELGDDPNPRHANREERESRTSRIQAKLREADQDFQQALRQHGVDPNRPDAIHPDTNNNLNTGVSPSKLDKSRKGEFGTPFDEGDPNRIIRNRPYRPDSSGAASENGNEDNIPEHWNTDDSDNHRLNNRRRDHRNRDDRDYIGFDEDGDGSIDY